MINPARFARNYNAANSVRRPVVRSGMVGTLTEKAKQYLTKTV